MTHGDVNTFAASLVEMALATKRVPELEAINAELTRERDEALDRIARMEVRSVQHRIEIEQLFARIRDLEVARDDAELRFLECDDARATILRTLRGIMGEAHSAIEAVDPTPVPPTPVVTEVPLTEVKLVDSPLTDAASLPEESPVESPTAPSVEPTGDAERDVCDQQVATYASAGQSAPNPTSAPTDGSGTGTEAVTLATEEVPASPTPFAASSSGEGSATVGEGVSGSASSPTLPSDPEPRDQLSDQWWDWHRRNHPEMYQPHSAA